MKIYVKDKELPKKTCENCPLCEYFDKDAHGKGKHEVACLYEGTFNNILFGDKLCPENCNIIKSLEQHDAEVRKQERQDIFMELNELKNYFDKRFNDFENNYEDETFSNIDMSNCYLDASYNLEGILEKLNDMKGE